MSAVANTIAERARYQADERALLADLGVKLPDEPPCRECGCTDSLACPQGCGWVQPDLCSVCAAELEDLADNPQKVRQLTADLRAEAARQAAGWRELR